jgi:hypothetical protein
MRVILLGLIGLSILCASCSTSSPEQEAANIRSVTSVFEELLVAHKLALPEAAEIADYTTFRLPNGSRRERYLRSISADNPDCKELYVVEAAFRTQQARYLFCKDRETPKLVAQYVREAGVWREIRGGPK